MWISIEITSHQYYEKRQGRVIAWGQTVEYFPHDIAVSVPDNRPFQVPCVLLREDNEINLIPLQRAAHTYKVWVISENE